MASELSFAPYGACHHPHQRRRRRPAWARPNGLAGTSSMFAAIPSLPRAELSRLTQRMIDRMDDIDNEQEERHD